MDILYTAHVTAKGGRDGSVRSDNGVLDLPLAAPKELDGPGGDATNPEQLFAAGYSACFLSALKFVAMSRKMTVPKDATVQADIGLGKVGEGFGLDANLAVHLPGMDKALASELMETAHQVCPYSNATRGNIKVRLSVSV